MESALGLLVLLASTLLYVTISVIVAGLMYRYRESKLVRRIVVVTGSEDLAMVMVAGLWPVAPLAVLVTLSLHKLWCWVAGE